jgi:hypothetical protein
MLDVRSFGAADCDTDHYRILAKFRERLAVGKQMEMFNLKRLNGVESKEQCHIEVSESFVAFKSLEAQVDINCAWTTIRENINISAKDTLGYYEWKKHNPWLDEGCSGLLDQRKQAKLQWLQDPSEINPCRLPGTFLMVTISLIYRRTCRVFPRLITD